MSEVLLNVDDDALAGAAKYLGTTGKEETVNAALREFDQRGRCLEAFDELVAMGESGLFDELLDKRNYRR
jgi:Arc/MetJ family transcription regulator